MRIKIKFISEEEDTKALAVKTEIYFDCASYVIKREDPYYL